MGEDTVSESRKRGCGATRCYGCLCDTCVHSVELHRQYFTPGETDIPCFTCDECRIYDGDYRKRDGYHDECPQYTEAKKAVEARLRYEEEAADKRARAARAKFTVIKGGIK